MIPTLSIGQRILVNRLDTHPGLGDIVVFHPPTGATGRRKRPVRQTLPRAAGKSQPCDKDVPASRTRPSSSGSSGSRATT